jgi:nitrogen fixation protein NifT
MKVMVRKVAAGYSIYVPKKDLEEAVVEAEKPALWGGWIRLKNGWRLELPDLAPDTRLPITVEAKKLADAA